MTNPKFGGKSSRQVEALVITRKTFLPVTFTFSRRSVTNFREQRNDQSLIFLSKRPSDSSFNGFSFGAAGDSFPFELKDRLLLHLLFDLLGNVEGVVGLLSSGLCEGC